MKKQVVLNFAEIVIRLARHGQTIGFGTPDQWPQNLCTTLGIMLHSAFLMFLFWGSDLICFYNDAFRPPKK